jgi:fibronectin type 3 domain-containing protein
LKYTDGSVTSGKTYYYVVTAVTSSGTESAHSGQVDAIIP